MHIGSPSLVAFVKIFADDARSARRVIDGVTVDRDVQKNLRTRIFFDTSKAMMDRLQPIPLVFWRSIAGREPVREWLTELPRDDQRVIGRDMGKVQYGWPVGLPLCRPLSGGLWEVRSSLPSRREARVLFGFHDGMLIALHGFIKKTQRTAADDLALARQRLKEATS